MSIFNGLISNETVTQQHGIGQKICLKSTCIYFRFCIFSRERHFNTSRDELLYSLWDVSLHPVLPAIVLQIFPHFNYQYILSLQYFVLRLKGNDKPFARNSPDVFEISVNSSVTELLDMWTCFIRSIKKSITCRCTKSVRNPVIYN
jgi:hypothetical protein